ALERDRRSYSSKAVLTLKLARGFNLDDELKNVITSRSKGQLRKFVNADEGRCRRRATGRGIEENPQTPRRCRLK
ncbi:hypothetical protein, partial [Bradyrhizobium sp. NAS80.1]|uniref:hypothetical protein n=1 Tax=Bradyrhizobium sp. NAS80.1 TaxID=1680159 RepID=UPI001AEF6BF5